MDFRLPVSSGTVPDSTVGKFDLENKVVAVGILFLSGPQAEIHLGAILPLLCVCKCVK